MALPTYAVGPIGVSEPGEVILRKRYLQPGESLNELFSRVAKHVASVEGLYGKPQHEIERTGERFYTALSRMLFLPNTPCLLHAGTDLGQLAACFVLPVEDSLFEITDTLGRAIELQKLGGGVGYNFSRLRPRGAPTSSKVGRSSGPVSFMEGYSGFLDTVKQAGVRGGGNMGILNVSHPDILEFIEVKRRHGPTCQSCGAESRRCRNFNLSVGVTDDFMRAVEAGADHELVYELDEPKPPHAVYKKLMSARELFQRIAEAAHETGDPGLVFLDAMNRGNPTPKLGRIEATNPCGEVPLLPYEACDLGSVNLARMVKSGRVDLDLLSDVVETGVRFLDNVIDANQYPERTPQIEDLVKGNRKIGLGVMGFADLLVQLGIPYSSPAAVEQADRLMAFIARRSKEASRTLAEEKEVFPNYFDSALVRGPKQRNAATNAIAPTGNISTLAGCSPSIEPRYAAAFSTFMDGGERLDIASPYFIERARREGFAADSLVRRLLDGASVDELGLPQDMAALFAGARDIPASQQIAIQAAFQRHTDLAVSKTVNLPATATVEDVEQAYWQAYRAGCKGITVFRSAAPVQCGESCTRPANGPSAS